MGYGVDYSNADEYILGTGADELLECLDAITTIGIINDKIVFNNENSYNKDLKYGPERNISY